MPLSEAQKRAKEKYRLKAREMLCLELAKGTKDRWKVVASEAGMTLSALIKKLISDFAEKNKPGERKENKNVSFDKNVPEQKRL